MPFVIEHADILVSYREKKMPAYKKLLLIMPLTLMAATPAPKPAAAPAGSQATTPPALAAPGAVLEKMSGTYAFTEGPACDAQGNVFFTDQPNDTIWKIDTDNKLSVF